MIYRKTWDEYLTDKIEYIKENINIDQLFQKLDIEIDKVSGDEVRMHCINSQHEDNIASLNYNVDKNIFRCLSCDCHGDVIDFIKIKNNINFKEAVNFLIDFVGVFELCEDEEYLMKKLNVKKYKKQNMIVNPIEIDLPSDFEIDFNKANIDIQRYLVKRKWNKSIVNQYMFGYCNKGYYKNRVIVPIIHFTKIVGFTARLVYGDVKNKYLFPKYCDTTKLIWGLFDEYNKNKPIFTEGIFDAIRLRSYGYNAFSILTNHLSDVQIKMIEKYFNKVIYIIPDNDNGGKIMINNFLNKLVHKKIIYVIQIEKEGIDPDNCTKEEINRYYKKAKLITNLY